MKKLLTLSAAAALSIASMSAFAASVDANFDVTVSLAARCVSTTTSAPALSFGTYDAMSSGSGSTQPTLVLTFNCTRGMAPPLVSLGDGSTSESYGVIGGLNYSITASSASVTPGSAATPTSGGVGSADVYSYTLTGTMASGQAGECSNANIDAGCGALTVATRTMTLTY